MATQDSGNPVLWFLSGAALGGVVALLFAPEAGRHTRRRLAKQAKKGTQALSESGREVYERGREESMITRSRNRRRIRRNV